MAFLGPNNAIAWANFRLRGGWKRSLLFSLAAVAILLCLILGGIHSAPAYATRTLYNWSVGMLALVAACLVLYASVRIAIAIRQDIQSRMIESHRLMPVAPLEAVAGYISGAAMQPLIFAAAIFSLGLIISGAGSVGPDNWAMACGVLFAFAIFIWTLAAYMSFSTRAGPALLFIPLFIIPSLADGNGLSTFPGLRVLLDPLFGNSIFDLRGLAHTIPADFAIAIAAQAYFTVLFFIAAARKYRSSDGIGLDALLGLLLLAGWTAISCIGLRAAQEYHSRTFRRSDASTEAQIVASLILGLLFALTPLSASARSTVRWRRHRIVRDPAPMRRPLPASLVFIVATILLLCVTLASHDVPVPSHLKLAYTAAIIAIAFFGAYVVFLFCYRASPRAAAIIFIWLLIAWGLPIAIDMSRVALSADLHPTTSPIFTASPIGGLANLWNQDPGDPNFIRPLTGILLEAAISCIPLIFWFAFTPQKRSATGVPSAAAGAQVAL